MSKKTKILFLKLDNLGDHIIFFDLLNKNVFCRDRFKLMLLTSQNKKNLRFLLHLNNFKFDKIYSVNSWIFIKVIKTFFLKGYFSYDYVINPVFSRTAIQDFYVSLFYGFKIAPKGDDVNYNDNDEYLKSQQKYDLILDHGESSSEYVKYEKFIHNLFTHINKKTFLKKVSIAPFANEDSRTWNISNWCQFLNLIPDKNQLHFDFVCPPEKWDLLNTALLPLNSDVSYTIMKGNLDVQFREILNSDILLCMDSSPYHFALLHGKTVICLSNGNHYNRFVPDRYLLNKKAYYLFPDTFLKLTESQREKVTCIRSIYDINEIKVNDLYCLFQYVSISNEANLV